MKKSKIIYILLIIFTLFLNSKIVLAYTNADCPSGYQLINANVCMRSTKAKSRNGVYYCDPGTGTLEGKECVSYYYLTPVENNEDDKCPSGYDLIDGRCLKYIGSASYRGGSYYCTNGTLIGNSCYSSVDVNTTLEDGKNKLEFSNTDYEHLCSSEPGVRNAVIIIGYVIQICRWVVPFLIIVLGIVAFTSAMLSGDEKAMGGAVKKLITKIIIGLLLFFIPTIILAVVNALEPTFGNVADEENSTFGACTKCLLDPYSCK